MKIKKLRKCTIYPPGCINPLEIEDDNRAFEDIVIRNRMPVLFSEHAGLETRNMR